MADFDPATKTRTRTRNKGALRQALESCEPLLDALDPDLVSWQRWRWERRPTPRWETLRLWKNWIPCGLARTS